MKVTATRINKRRGAPNWGEEISKAIDQEIEKNVKPELRKRFEAVVANWEHKPQFVVQKSVSSKEISIGVYARGKNKNIWNWVSRGTKGPYPIPKNPATSKTLRFVWGGPGSYRPKTKRSPVSWGGPGTVSGGQVVYRKQVEHPGIEGRHFEEQLGSLYSGQFAMRIQNAIRRALNKARFTRIRV